MLRDPAGTPGQPDLSIVIPVYNEEATLPELFRRIAEILPQAGSRPEVILVDDGSHDGTADLVARICRADQRFRGIHFSRNFGQEAAVAAGLKYASGRAVVVMDADLQDPPALIPRLLEQWREGYEVVYARHTTRESEGVVKRGAAFLFYRVLSGLAERDVPADSGDFCLMDRRVVDLLTTMPERNRFIRGLRAWVGFRQTSVEFDRPARFAGEPKYTFRRSFRLGLDGLISLSKAPLKLGTYLGLLVSATSFLLGIAFLIQKLTVGFEVRGWASMMVTILFLGGVQLLTVGIIGEYIGRIYDEVKLRPLYVVSSLDNLDEECHPERSEGSSRLGFDTRKEDPSLRSG